MKGEDGKVFGVVRPSPRSRLKDITELGFMCRCREYAIQPIMSIVAEDKFPSAGVRVEQQRDRIIVSQDGQVRLAQMNIDTSTSPR